IAGLLLIAAQLIGLDLADQLLHPGLDLAQRLALNADLRADAERVEIPAQCLAHAALDPAALGIGGSFARIGLAGHDAMALELALLRADSREALTMRAATFDTIIERQRFEKLRPCGLEVFVRARRVLAVRELAGADLCFDLVLVEHALLLVARRCPR